MIVHKRYDRLNFRNPIVTLGIFDGVHRGHRTLLDTLSRRASERGGESVVITFDPHPRLVLDRNRSRLSFLSTMEEKKALLEKTHADHLIIMKFTAELSRMKACDFVKEILAGKIKTRHLVIGHDHHFGYRGEGDYETVSSCASSLGFTVEQIEGLRSREGTISSSLIREALLTGNLDNANRWLGYCYSLKGKVIEGKRIGRKLGFPTANIEPDYRYKLVPANGVYAVEIKIDGITRTGMLSIGTNPTVNMNNTMKSIEVNIFGFEGDIYGKEMELLFRYRLRDEMKFDSTAELASQMENDRSVAMKLLA